MLSGYKSIVDGIPLPAVLIGPDQRVAVINRPAEALFGAGLLGRHHITALRQPNLLDAIERVSTGQDVMAEAIYLATEAMRDTTYEVRAARVDASDGIAVLVTFTDRTELQEAGQMRRDFVANVSHELRTPLTALLGFIETLRGAARDDQAARERFLSIMEAEAGRMNRLVHDLLSLSRVESEERVRPQDPVDVAAIAGSVANALRPMARDAECEIVLDESSTPMIVPGDADQIRQIISNLVENAIKYGGAGTRIDIELSKEAHLPFFQGEAIVVSVRDNGEGFDPVHISRLTERFYRVDDHRSRELGGTGLGLAIVKHIVNRHRGRLRIETEPGHGSRFSVVLPAA